jgi:hypothetical protein
MSAASLYETLPHQNLWLLRRVNTGAEYWTVCPVPIQRACYATTKRFIILYRGSDETLQHFGWAALAQESVTTTLLLCYSYKCPTVMELAENLAKEVKKAIEHSTLDQPSIAAVIEFQKLLDHRGIVLNFVTGALAHLQLGRAYAMAGDSGKAKTAYEGFLAVWKDADTDIPILKQAKAEYARLK